MRYLLFGVLVCAVFLGWFASKEQINTAPMTQALPPAPPAATAAPAKTQAKAPAAAPASAPETVKSDRAGDSRLKPAALVHAQTDRPTDLSPAAQAPQPAALEYLMSDPDWDNTDLNALVDAFHPDQQEDARAVLEAFAADERTLLQ